MRTFFIFLMLIVIDAKSTTVVIIPTPSGIYAGADSKMTITNPRSVHGSEAIVYDTVYAEMCKIQSFGKINVAVANGYPIISMAIAKWFCSSAEPSRQLFRRYGDSLAVRIANDLTKLRKIPGSSFQSTCAQGGAIASTAFFGYRDGMPYIYAMNFMLVDCTADTLEVLFVGEIIREDFAVMGRSEKIKEALPVDFSAEPTEKIIERFITLERKANPISVGGKIDILKVTNSERLWLQHKVECE